MPLHLMTLLHVCHFGEDGEVLWEEFNVPNIFHYGGEEFLLKVAFNTASSVTVPTNYYAGLDNRTTLAAADTLGSSLGTEPNSGGYSRQSISSVNGFTVAAGLDSNIKATSGVLQFSATGSGYGPVKNIFLATGASSTGYLISSAPISSSRTLTAGQVLTARVAVGLRNC